MAFNRLSRLRFPTSELSLDHVHLGHQRYKSWKQFLDHAYWSVELK